MEKLIQYCTKDSLYDGPFDKIVGWRAAGMGYILKTCDKKLIVIDGGNSNDAKDLTDLILKTANDDRADIDLWIVTHPHRDHYAALLEICKSPELYEKLCVKEVLYYFPDEFVNAKGDHACKAPNEDMALITQTLGALAHTPKLDEKIIIDGIEIHFLYVPDDCSILNNANQLSLIFTVQCQSSKIMITGDAFAKNLQIVVDRCKEDLKCDVLQMPHHGLCDTGLESFYRLVAAKTVLIPISIAGDRTMRSDMYGNAPRVNRDAENYADKVYKAFEGTVEIEL